MDALTKLFFLYAVKSTQSRYVLLSLQDLIKIFGTPRRIIIDQGSAFTSHSMKNFCKTWHIKHHLNAVGLPQGNGQVERYHRTLLQSSATMGAINYDDMWDENVITIQLGWNGTINSATGVIPSEALMGYRVKKNPPLDNGIHTSVDVTQVRKNLTQRIKQHQKEQKQRFDSKRREAPNYAIGDLAILKVITNSATGQSQKLLPKWRRPFRISKVLEHDRYGVTDIPGAIRSRVKYKG